MKVLWLAPLAPGLYGGAAVRDYHLLRHLSQRHRIALVALSLAGTPHRLDDLRRWGVDATLIPFRPPPPQGPWRRRALSWLQLLADPRPELARTYPLAEWRRAVRRAAAAFQPDLVHCSQLFAAPLMDVVPDAPALLDEHNAEWLNARRQADAQPRALRRFAGRLDAWKLARWERRWLRRSAQVTAVSADDAAWLRRWLPAERLAVVPNGVDSAAFEPSPDAAARRSGMLFFGNLGYAPNAAAVLSFCRDVLPRVRERIPGVHLRIAGPGAGREVAALGKLAGVMYDGYLPDVRTALWQASLCVVPLQSGGGTRLKILEALAAGCAVLSTSVGAEGLGLTPGMEIEIADDAAQMAEAAARLLGDAAARERLARRGREAVRRRFDWSDIAPLLEAAHKRARLPRP